MRFCIRPNGQQEQDLMCMMFIIIVKNYGEKTKNSNNIDAAVGRTGFVSGAL